MSAAPLQRIASRVNFRLKRQVNRHLAARRYVLLRYATDERAGVIDLVERVRAEVDFQLDYSEACQLVNAVRQTEKRPGDLAEVGVYQGGSSKVICETKGDRVLHLFDTFEGLPEPNGCDEARFHRGQYRGGLAALKEYLKGYRNVHIYGGYFPDTSGPVRDRLFSFVHLDVDLYQSTLDCLGFFYPRMVPGGVLISHDYNNASGVRRAFTEFFADRPEPVIEVALSQALVVKV